MRINGGKTLFTIGPTASRHGRNKPKGTGGRAVTRMELEANWTEEAFGVTRYAEHQ